ncbi:class I SAM-dependent methyltransferase [Patescibacteria group bacterium]|nr:class I SAM-dependent methyltransferase [Patescibacteria group bacterium]
MADQVSGGNELLNPEKILKKVGIGFGDKVIDLGCGGAAFFTLQAARMVGQDGVVYAVDVLKPVLASVESKAFLNGVRNIKTVWSDLEVYNATNIPDETADLAMLINVLFQSEKKLELIKEGVRMVKSGGRFLFIDWKDAGAPFGPPKKMRVSPDEIRQIAKQLNLKEIEYFDAGTYHYAFIFAK